MVMTQILSRTIQPVPLTELRERATGRLIEMRVEQADAEFLAAVGLRPDCSVTLCRLGRPCVIAIRGACGGGCRVGVPREIASRLLVEPTVEST